MNADGMADEAVVPSTRVNKAATAVAESAEERDLTEGKYCRIGVDASDSEPEQVSIGASREITTGSVTVCRDRLTQRRSRMSQGSRTDLCGGRLATAVPTAILENLRRTLRSDEPCLLGRELNISKQHLLMHALMQLQSDWTLGGKLDRRVVHKGFVVQESLDAFPVDGDP